MAEVLILCIIVLFLFGAKRLPEIGRGIGQALRSYHDQQEPFEPWVLHLALAAALLVVVGFALAERFGLLRG